jgi:molecular chaperone DnaK
MTHVGIDLGTTFSAISYLDGVGRSSICPIGSDGERICASVVYRNPRKRGTLEVGGYAAKAAAEFPEAVAGHFKISMGTNDLISLGDEQYTATTLSSVVLKKLVKSFEEQHGKLSSAVITVPANFTESARAETLKAAEMAGISAKHIINEPTAAILAFTQRAEITGTVLVYDFGGGTFDATIAEVEGSRVRVLTSDGDKHLGGKDLDKVIFDFFANKYREATGVKWEASRDDEDRFKMFQLKAENIKKDLSRNESVIGYIHCGTHGETVRVEITRAEFEHLISNYLSRADTLVEVALDAAGLEPSDIDEIIMVGGSTRIPDVRNRIEKMFGKKPMPESVSVDECVAMGAAIYAGLQEKQSLNMRQKKSLEKVSLQDITPHFFGTECLNDDDEGVYNAIILKKDTPTPCKTSATFYTSQHGQTEVLCKITQSGYPESDLDLVTEVAVLHLDLPGGRPSGQAIEVEYSYDTNGIMHCKFEDVGSKSIAEYKHDNSSSSIEDLGASAMNLEDFIIE